MAIGHNSKNFVSANSLASKDRKKLKKVIVELEGSLTRIAAEKEFQKETIEALAEELGIEKKLIRKLAKTYFMANFNAEKEQIRNFEEFYELVMNTKEDDAKEATIQELK